MVRGLAFTVACLLLGACQDELAPKPEPVLPPELVAQEQAAQDCIAQGGTHVINGVGMGMCQVKTADGGKSCVSSNDCEGFCLAEGQICTSNSPHFGCFETYENGQRPTVCVD